MGFSPTQKGYKILDLHSNKVLLTRNIHFHEHIFPFHHISSSNTQSVLPPSISDFNIFFSCPSSSTQNSSISTISNNQCSTSNNTPSHNTIPDTDLLSNISPSPPLPSTDLRRSIRQTKPPIHLQDYVLHTTTQSPLSPQPHYCNLVTFSSLPFSQQQTLALQATYTEPQTYHEAILDAGWTEAMKKEISTLLQNETWEYTDLPQGKRLLVANEFIKQNTIKMAL